MYVKGKFLSLICIALTVLPAMVVAKQEQDNKPGMTLKTVDPIKTGQSTSATAIKPAGVKTDSSHQGNNLSKTFPRWPGQKPAYQHTLVPPPPLGPYMSTALNNTPMAVPLSGHPSRSPSIMHERAEPMAMFNPDLPWPGDRVNRWRPENGGYHYVTPSFQPPVYPSVSHRAYQHLSTENMRGSRRAGPAENMDSRFNAPMMNSTQYPQYNSRRLPDGRWQKIPQPPSRLLTQSAHRGFAGR